MLREKLKQELDHLDEEQLEKIADFIAFIQFQSQKFSDNTPLWQKLTPEARASEFQDWVSQLPETGVSLSDEAFSRDSIYEE
ncbi:MAG: hypothetical protein RLZZ507_18 [Cyanobacteriota bacterium]|jgi:hypothetical protein